MAAFGYDRKLLTLAGLALAATTGAGLFSGQLMQARAPGENFWTVFPVLIIVAAIALAACVPWWRKADDRVRQGHANSWYWGSSAGALAVLMYLIAATGLHSEVSLGALYLFLGQFAGFLVFFGLWKWRGRGLAE